MCSFPEEGVQCKNPIASWETSVGQGGEKSLPLSPRWWVVLLQNSSDDSRGSVHSFPLLQVERFLKIQIQCWLATKNTSWYIKKAFSGKCSCVRYTGTVFWDFFLMEDSGWMTLPHQPFQWCVWAPSWTPILWFQNTWNSYYKMAGVGLNTYCIYIHEGHNQVPI